MLEREGHDKLHRQLIKQENRPCTRCSSTGERDVHRLVKALGYTRDNAQVLCTKCHCDTHYQGKFQKGDKVYLNGRTPAYIDLLRHRPRTVIAISYSPQHQANLYSLGSNGRGACAGEPASSGYAAYAFRSYQLHPWHSIAKGQLGRPRSKRPYIRLDKDSKSSTVKPQDFRS